MTTRRKVGEREPRALRESVEEVWLAGLGALAVAEEEGSRVFRTLMKRGEKLEHRLVRRGTEVERTIGKSVEQRRDAIEKAGRAQLRDVREMGEQVGTFTEDAIARVNRGFDEGMDRVLHRIGVPTSKEIEALTKRVEALRETLARNAKPATRAKPAARKRHAAARHATKRRPTAKANTPPLPVPVAPVGADV